MSSATDQRGGKITKSATAVPLKMKTLLFYCKFLNILLTCFEEGQVSTVNIEGSQWS